MQVSKEIYRFEASEVLDSHTSKGNGHTQLRPFVATTTSLRAEHSLSMGHSLVISVVASYLCLVASLGQGSLSEMTFCLAMERIVTSLQDCFMLLSTGSQLQFFTSAPTSIFDYNPGFRT